ncbi:YkgJ family cysteine cluster protein [uncultured Desulfosarcina sp.]|uniref:YkgJ family cysteine cluster protein n=1 Tax=uncultured Desulfosarcina sp. TaxID=218289 RepID=UPI0029C8ACAF|nr:YkgJ family cysteine cluster protein [uncultured Desulfosarcina sp.]
MLDFISQLMALYAEIDKEVAAFQLKSGLRCPAGCGDCCATADVQVTVLEMLPMAHAMLCDGTAAQSLERLSGPNGSGTCVLYTAHPVADTAGHCGQYPWRPGLCRLFGFAAVRGRTGSKTLAVCRHIRQNDPHGASAAMTLAEEAPLFVQYSAQISGLDPVLGARPMPINIALHQAIQRLGLNAAYAHLESFRDNTAA